MSEFETNTQKTSSSRHPEISLLAFLAIALAITAAALQTFVIVQASSLSAIERRNTAIQANVASQTVEVGAASQKLKEVTSARNTCAYFEQLNLGDLKCLTQFGSTFAKLDSESQIASSAVEQATQRLVQLEGVARDLTLERESTQKAIGIFQLTANAAFTLFFATSGVLWLRKVRAKRNQSL